jgi:hypothetical protein
MWHQILLGFYKVSVNKIPLRERQVKIFPRQRLLERFVVIVLLLELTKVDSPSTSRGNCSLPLNLTYRLLVLALDRSD